MKKTLLVLLSAAAVCGCAAPYAPAEFDFSELGGGRAGVVELVQGSDRELGSRVLVRLDNGFSLEASAETPGLRPGERVRVVSRGRVALE